MYSEVSVDLDSLGTAECVLRHLENAFYSWGVFQSREGFGGLSDDLG